MAARGLSRIAITEKLRIPTIDSCQMALCNMDVQSYPTNTCIFYMVSQDLSNAADYSTILHAILSLSMEYLWVTLGEHVMHKLTHILAYFPQS